MCYTQKYFQCLERIKPITIKLPNGSLVAISFSGTIQFNRSFYITDVLYIPDFAFNHISAPKLTKTLHCQLLFNTLDCVIHDLCSKKMIDTTELHGGLYLLTFPPVTLHNTPSAHYINSTLTRSIDKSPNCSLWHLRLGHASYAKLLEFNKSFSFIKPVMSIIIFL